ncbi:MAG: hypothetical protein V4587_00755, partial [Acidobacteriota bacterium]
MKSNPIASREQQSDFERLITGLSLRFIKSSGTSFDTNIEAALKTVCDSLSLDYSAVAQWDHGSEVFVVTHSWML